MRPPVWTHYELTQIASALLRHRPALIRTHSLFRLRAAMRRIALSPAVSAGMQDPNQVATICGIRVIEDPLIPLDVAVLVSKDIDACGLARILAAIAISPQAGAIADEYIIRRADAELRKQAAEERSGSSGWLESSWLRPEDKGDLIGQAMRAHRRSA